MITAKHKFKGQPFFLYHISSNGNNINKIVKKIKNSKSIRYRVINNGYTYVIYTTVKN